MARVIESLPGHRIRRAAELGDALDLDGRLAWKISRVVNDSDPFAAARFVPGAGGVREFLRAARRKQAAESDLEAVQDAYAGFSDLVRAHAGDRKTFDMMAAGLVKTDRARGELEHRKGAFHHLSYVLGVQAQTQLHTYILAPSNQAAFFDLAIIRGFVDLRRIRPSVPWRIIRPYTVDDAGNLRISFVRQPLEEAEASRPPDLDLPIWSKFCSDPLPPFRRVAGSTGQVEYQLGEGNVGNAGLFTVVIAEVLQAVEPRYRDEHHHDLVVQARIRTPCKALVFDLLVHRGLFGRIAPTLLMYSDLFTGGLSAELQSCDRLPVFEKVEYLGEGIGAARAAEIPRYEEMVAEAFDRLRWDPEQFEVHRLRMLYPPIPSTVSLQHELPVSPSAGA
jgi:hypothetical protein